MGMGSRNVGERPMITEEFRSNLEALPMNPRAASSFPSVKENGGKFSNM